MRATMESNMNPRMLLGVAGGLLAAALSSCSTVDRAIIVSGSVLVRATLSDDAAMNYSDPVFRRAFEEGLITTEIDKIRFGGRLPRVPDAILRDPVALENWVENLLSNVGLTPTAHSGFAVDGFAVGDLQALTVEEGVSYIFVDGEYICIDDFDVEEGDGTPWRYEHGRDPDVSATLHFGVALVVDDG